MFLHSTNVDPTVKPVHLPYGIPRVLQENVDYCVLLHSDYITGFSKDVRMPLWVAYTLNPGVSVWGAHVCAH